MARMKNTCLSSILVALLLGAFAPSLRAQSPTNAPPRRLQPSRWLIVVDTSSAMQRRANATEELVGELLATGMHGHMQPGDEIGIWTFNKELYSGVAPLQTWQLGKSNIIADRSVNFLSKQPHKSKSRLEPVTAELARLVPESHRLTVLLFSDGTAKLAGTPYDADVNAAYTNSRPNVAKSRAPLVTVLRTQRGKYVGQSVSTAPWPIDFPPFPELPPPPPAPVPPAPQKAAAAIGKPIIIKPEPAKPEPVAPRPALTAPPEPVTPQPIKSAEAVPVVPRVESPAAPKPVEPPAPAPHSAAALAPTPEPATAPVPTPAATPTPAPAPTATPAPVETAQVQTPPPVSAPAASALPPSAGAPAAAMAAAAVPAPSLPAATVTARKWPLILGIACMWVAIVIALVLARRARRTPATSLITRSLDKANH
jgi:hypothetical protein